MVKNIGNPDKILRVVVALIIAGLYFSGAVTGVTATILSVLAVVFLITAAIGYCPLYFFVLGKFSTNKEAK